MTLPHQYSAEGAVLTTLFRCVFRYSWIPLGGTLDPGRHRGCSWIPVGTVGTPGFSLAQWVILDPRRESRSTLLIIFDPFSAFVRSAFRVCSICSSGRYPAAGGFPWQHHRKVKNTQNYEFFHFKKMVLVLSIPLDLSLGKNSASYRNAHV